jgi:glutamyl/glutaminyl-tRNA synthetase
VKAGEKHSVKLALDCNKQATIFDLVQGDLRFKTADYHDPILVRRDGSPTRILLESYFCHTNDVNLIVRITDSINVTFFQYLIYLRLGWRFPDCGHIQFLQWDDGQVLSVRKAGAQVRELREEGYLPMSLERMLLQEVLDEKLTMQDNKPKLDRFQNLPELYSRQNLLDINRQLIDSQDDVSLKSELLPFINEFIPQSTRWSESKLNDALQLVKYSAPTLRYMALNLSPIVAPELDLETFREYSPESQPIISSLLDQLNHRLEDDGQLQLNLHSWVDSQDDEDTIEAVRFALTGRCTGGDIGDIYQFLGNKEFVERLGRVTQSLG